MNVVQLELDGKRTRFASAEEAATAAKARADAATEELDRLRAHNLELAARLEHRASTSALRAELDALKLEVASARPAAVAAAAEAAAARLATASADSEAALLRARHEADVAELSALSAKLDEGVASTQQLLTELQFAQGEAGRLTEQLQVQGQLRQTTGTDLERCKAQLQALQAEHADQTRTAAEAAQHVARAEAGRAASEVRCGP